MDTSVGADDFQQPVGIGGFQLGEHTVFQHLIHNGVLSLQLFQHVRVGAPTGLGLFPGGQHQLVKEHLPQLLGGVDVEFMARLVPDALLQRGDPGVQALPEIIQGLPVYKEAGFLHLRQHLAEGQLNGGIQLLHAQLFQLFLQRLVQPVHGLRAVQLPSGVAHGDAGQRIIALGGLQQIGGQSRIEQKALGLQPLGQKQTHQILYIVGDFFRLRGEEAL